MQLISFDVSQDIPIIDAIVRGPRDFHRIRLVFDTGSGLTQLDADLVESLGYSAGPDVSPESVAKVGRREQIWTKKAQQY